MKFYKRFRQSLPFLILLTTASFFVFSFHANASHPKTLIADDVVSVTNNIRNGMGLSQLTTNPKLTEAAEEKIKDMEERKYFAHQDPQGLAPWYWFQKEKYSYAFAGENLAINFTDAKKLMTAWLQSPSHKDNILNPIYKDIGVGVKQVKIDGRTYTLIVQLFGTAKPDYIITLR